MTRITDTTLARVGVTHHSRSDVNGVPKAEDPRGGDRTSCRRNRYLTDYVNKGSLDRSRIILLSLEATMTNAFTNVTKSILFSKSSYLPPYPASNSKDVIKEVQIIWQGVHRLLDLLCILNKLRRSAAPERKELQTPDCTHMKECLYLYSFRSSASPMIFQNIEVFQIFLPPC